MAAVRGGRTGLAAAAGIVLIVLGVLGGLLGLALAVFGSAFHTFDLSQFPGGENVSPNAADVVGGVFVFVGIIILVYSVLYLIGGIGVLRSREWGRVIGIVVGLISGLFWLAALGGSGNNSNGSGGIGFALILLLCHLYIVVVLGIRWRNRSVVVAG